MLPQWTVVVLCWLLAEVRMCEEKFLFLKRRGGGGGVVGGGRGGGAEGGVGGVGGRSGRSLQIPFKLIGQPSRCHSDGRPIRFLLSRWKCLTSCTQVAPPPSSGRKLIGGSITVMEAEWTEAPADAPHRPLCCVGSLTAEWEGLNQGKRCVSAAVSVYSSSFLKSARLPRSGFWL